MPNPLFITCVAVQFRERFLDRWMFQQLGMFKGIECWAEGFVGFRVDHTCDGFNGMDTVRNRIRILLHVDMFRRLTQVRRRPSHVGVLYYLDGLLRCFTGFLAHPWHDGGTFVYFLNEISNWSLIEGVNQALA